MRPKIGEFLKRDVLTEAGHRCAIPTCKQTTTQIAHIIAWSKVKKHEFHNLIALCPNCHSRYDKGEIDKKSMLYYKQNLSILNSRYGDLERRILRIYADAPNREVIYLHKSLELLTIYLIEDGLLELDEWNSMLGDNNIFKITQTGKDFVRKWLNAEPIE